MDHDTKSFSEKLNFSFSFWPIYYFARVCGQMPFSILIYPNGAIAGPKMYKRDLIWFAIAMCIHCAFICMSVHIIQFTHVPNEIISVLHFGNLTAWFIMLLFGISMIVLDAYKRNEIVDILKKITVFDREVRDRLNFEIIFRWLSSEFSLIINWKIGAHGCIVQY